MQLVRLGADVQESRHSSKAIEKMVVAVAKSKKAILMVGAGVSTTAGIPDFRSKDVGLYSSSSTPTPSASASTSTPLKGPAMFSASVYSSPATTSQHLQFLSSFKSSLDSITSDPPTATHGFMKLLKNRGQLRRVYTQNIDGLEERAGLVAVQIEGVKLSKGEDDSIAEKSDIKGKGKEKLEGDCIQLHGSIYRVRCSSCDYVAEWKDEIEIGQEEGVAEVFARGEVAACPQCTTRAAIRAAQHKRSLPSRSFLRPAITLYEENSPAALSIGTLSLSDLTLGGGPDLMIVMGTSLKIPGFKKLVKEFAKAVKAKGGLRILVNREEIKGQEWKDVFDYNVISDSEVFVNRIVSDWKRTRPRDWAGRQTNLFESFTNVKNGTVAATSSKKPTSRPALRPLSSNTILPPLPPLSDFSTSPKKHQLGFDDSTSTPPHSKRPKLVTSPSKPRTSRTSLAASCSSPIPSLSTRRSTSLDEDEFSSCFSPTSTPPDPVRTINLSSSSSISSPGSIVCKPFSPSPASRMTKLLPLPSTTQNQSTRSAFGPYKPPRIQSPPPNLSQPSTYTTTNYYTPNSESIESQVASTNSWYSLSY